MTIRMQAYLAAASAAVILAASGAAYAAVERNQPADHEAFDFDEGNAVTDVFVPFSEETVTQNIKPSDATIILHLTVLLSNAWFDAIAPYHQTAVGVYSDLGRRPAAESETNRNLNVAILYATYRVLNRLLPEQTSVWRDMLLAVDLDPDDDQENTETAIGIGNRAGNAVMDSRERDGLNLLGDEGGQRYHNRPYADYTGYEPVNTAYELRDPSRWQPDIVPDTAGIFQVQQFVTPQMRLTTPYSYDDPRQFRVARPWRSNHHHRRAYRHQADQVLAASAELTEERKLKAEFFDNKFLALGLSTSASALSNGLSLEEFIHYHFTLDVASFDTAIAVWQEKHRHDAVRPFSAIAYLYGDDSVTAWGGPGEGIVDDLPGSQWRSYLQSADHPEYPSASMSFCSAHAEAARNFLGSDNLDFSFTFPQGSSSVEPGVTPAADTVLSWDTWSSFARECGESRVWAGVHFPAAVTAGEEFGPQFGERAYEFVQDQVDGG